MADFHFGFLTNQYVRADGIFQRALKKIAGISVRMFETALNSSVVVRSAQAICFASLLGLARNSTAVHPRRFNSAVIRGRP